MPRYVPRYTTCVEFFSTLLEISYRQQLAKVVTKPHAGNKIIFASPRFNRLFLGDVARLFDYGTAFGPL